MAHPNYAVFNSLPIRSPPVLINTKVKRTRRKRAQLKYIALCIL
jgi:hypothetical protein